MREIGIVKKTDSKNATVVISKKDECSKCGMCAFPKNASQMEVRCSNEIGAKEGDVVKIERKENGKILGALLVFLIPIILIGVSVLVGILLLKNEILIPIIAIVLIILWFVVLAITDKKLKKLSGFTSVILSVEERPSANENL